MYYLTLVRSASVLFAAWQHPRTDAAFPAFAIGTFAFLLPGVVCCFGGRAQHLLQRYRNRLIRPLLIVMLTVPSSFAAFVRV